MSRIIILLALLAFNALVWGWALRRAIRNIPPELHEDQRFVWIVAEVSTATFGMIVAALAIFACAVAMRLLP
jgi:hydrogenase-4 membrane subunit HyfE